MDGNRVCEEFSPPYLAVVATPIGHLADISPRGAAVLASSDVLFAEDTRNTRKLLTALDIPAPQIISYYDQKEEQLAKRLVASVMEKNQRSALVSDAGTPSINDPGYRLLREAHQQGLRVYAVPGPSAVAAIASVSGLAGDRLHFVGYLPTKKQALEEEIASWKNFASGSVIFLESPKRLSKSISVVASQYPGARMALGKELTKVHETIRSDTVERIAHWIGNELEIRGEFVCALELPEREETEIDWEVIRDVAGKLFQEGASLREALEEFGQTGAARNQLYKLLLEVKDGH